MAANKFSTFSEEVGYIAQAMFSLTLIYWRKKKRWAMINTLKQNYQRGNNLLLLIKNSSLYLKW